MILLVMFRCAILVKLRLHLHVDLSIPPLGVQILISHGSGFISRLHSNTPTGAVVYTSVWVCILCIINSIPCTVGVYMLRHSDWWNSCVWTIRQKYMYFNLPSLGDRWLELYIQCSLHTVFIVSFKVFENVICHVPSWNIWAQLQIKVNFVFSALLSAMPIEGHWYNYYLKCLDDNCDVIHGQTLCYRINSNTFYIIT